MLTAIEQLQRFVTTNADPKSRLDNYVIPGLSSLMIDAKMRIFVASRAQSYFVIPHDHPCDHMAIVIEGTVTNTIYYQSEVRDKNEPKVGRDYEVREVKVSLKSKTGIEYKVSAFTPPLIRRFYLNSKTYRAGDSYFMNLAEIHSVEFSSDAKVLIFEGPKQSDTNIILLDRVVNEHTGVSYTIENFRYEPWMFINPENQEVLSDKIGDSEF